MNGLSLKATTQMGVVMSDEDNEDDESFLRSLIRLEEGRRRLHFPGGEAIAGFVPPMSYRWKDTGSGATIPD